MRNHKIATTSLLLAALCIAFAPTAGAHGKPTIDVDLDVQADGTVVARAETTAQHDVRFEWDWDDGDTSHGAHAEHTYATPGTYRVELRVTDEQTGRCWTERRTITVEPEVDDADDDDDSAPEKPDRARREPRRAAAAESSVSVGGVGAHVSARVAWGGGADEHAGSGADARAAARAQTHDHERRDSPGAGAAWVLPAVGSIAWALRRRG